VLQREEGDEEERFIDAPLPASDDDDDADADGKGKKRGAGMQLGARVDLGDDIEPEDDEDATDEDLDADADADGDVAMRGASAASRAAAAAAAAQPRAGAGGRGRALASGYDMGKREPQYAGAERAGVWELSVLSAHMHPSVAAMARTLCAGAHVVYAGDPLRDLSLAAFLDRWLQKKPKAAKKGPADGSMGRQAAAASEAGGADADGEGAAAPGTAEFAAMMVRRAAAVCGCVADACALS
jgi:ribosome biogenesis protein MAK21